MESIGNLQELLTPTSWTTSIDITQAFHHVKVIGELSAYLAFSFNNQTYSYVDMPFEVSLAPRAFYKTLKPPGQGEVVRVNNRNNSIFDDSQLEDCVKEMSDQCKVEFSVPRVVIQYPIRNNEDKVRTQNQSVETGQPNNQRCVEKDTQKEQIAGSTKREIELPATSQPTNKLPLKGGELEWWRSRISENKTYSYSLQGAAAILTTDASQDGWSGIIQIDGMKEKIRTGGNWQNQEQRQSSNFREIKAIQLSLNSVKEEINSFKVKNILIHTDNSTTAYNLNRRRACKALSQITETVLKNGSINQINYDIQQFKIQ
ncbi:MAG: hypothetical protein EZS28_021710 [Streblomastix strix]|uniref:Reverse transcriptase domain-containing protein n=1 Tax=Streblomastix strix TaxID=222440 RepID=A0A5J4VJH9_9EUKA|nr:MAG: hypothetical protein EZS28_021710 [Streblomastix strix]